MIESVIGTGAMGSVYLARHCSLDTRVAIKVMHEEMAKDQTFAERFLREARAASRLDHPHVIRVRDYGTEPDGLHYLVMEYVDGVDLGQLVVRDFPMSDVRIVDILSQVLGATAAAHAVGIVHRDLKPENVMVSTRFDDDGRKHELVKVCDFGIAQLSELPKVEPPKTEPHSQKALTLSGVLLGTPQYMSPEQCRGEQLDARSDLYSIGVMLYELLAGRPPFVADNFIDIVVKQVSEDPEPPRVHNPNVSLALEQVCMRALRKRPEERYTTAREMRAALRYAVGMSDHPTAALFVPEFRAPVPGTDTQPAFSSRVPSSRRAGGEVPTLQFSEPRRAAAPGSSKAFRYVFAATLVALAGLAIVVGKDEIGASSDPHPARDGVAVFENPVAPAPTAAPMPPGEPATLMDERSDERPVATVPSVKSRTRSHAAGAHDAPRVLVATAERGSSSAALPEPPAASAPSPLPRESVKAPAAPAPVPVESAVLPESPPKLRPPPLDPSKGNVTWRVSSVGGGATSGGVARALSRSASSWTECYRAGLRARSARVEGSATLRIACDDQGRVVEAKVSGFPMTDVARCVEQRVTGATIPNADTGEAWSTVSLSFKLNE